MLSNNLSTAIYSKDNEKIDHIHSIVIEVEKDIKNKKIILKSKDDIKSKLLEILTQNWYTVDDFNMYYKMRIDWIIRPNFSKLNVAKINDNPTIINTSTIPPNYKPIIRKKEINLNLVKTKKGSEKDSIYIKWVKYYLNHLMHFKQAFFQARWREINNKEELRNFLDKNPDVIQKAIELYPIAE